jgi:hypothetical protein
MLSKDYKDHHKGLYIFVLPFLHCLSNQLNGEAISIASLTKISQTTNFGSAPLVLSSSVCFTFTLNHPGCLDS